MSMRKPIIITNDKEAKDFVLSITDASIGMHLACFEAQGVDREDIINIAVEATKYIHKLIVEAGFEEDGINVNNCISMLVFSSAMKAYLDVVDDMAKEKGVNREVFLNEMYLDEFALLKGLFNTKS